MLWHSLVWQNPYLHHTWTMRDERKIAITAVLADGGGGKGLETHDFQCHCWPLATLPARNCLKFLFRFWSSMTFGARIFEQSGSAIAMSGLHWKYCDGNWEPNSWTYNFVEVSGHNLESYQTWGFHIECLHHYAVSDNFFSGGRGGGSKIHCRLLNQWLSRILPRLVGGWGGGGGLRCCIWQCAG
jgi:hypothetical protein